MLKKINFSDNDILYILGDTFDRGKDGAEVFLDAATDKRVVLLMGNHEHMLYEANENPLKIRQWLNNGAEETIGGFERNGMTITEISEIIGGLPVVMPEVKVGGQNFYLSHSFPYICPGGTARLADFKNTGHVLEETLWNRDGIYSNGFYHGFMKRKYPGTKFVFGHTPTILCEYRRMDAGGRPLISRTPDGFFFNVDCGCGHKKIRGRLGCLCLESMEEFYA